MSESKEIANFDELRKIRLADEGYIVITDGSRHAVVHKVNSMCVTSDNFNVKVSINAGTKGRYYWVDSIATAAREHGAKRCKTCRPEVLLVDPSTFRS